jgi:hypothetical protein
MKAWRSLKAQEQVRFELYDSLDPKDARQRANQLELVKRGANRVRVGRYIKGNKVRFLGVPSPLFQRMMIHAGLAPQP